MTPNNNPPVKATQTSCRVLDAVIEADEASLATLVDRLDYSKSSIHNHLQTLEQVGLLVKDGQVYSPSLQFLEIGNGVRREFEFYRRGRTKAGSLSNVTGLNTSLLVLERGQLTCLYTDTPNAAEEPIVAAGDRLPFHCTAAGKAVLATLSLATVRELLPTTDLPAYTENTITATDKLLRTLEGVRSQGWAADSEEWQPEIRSLGTTVTDTNGDLHGVLCVTGHTSTLSGKRFEQDIPGLLISSANDIQTELGQ